MAMQILQQLTVTVPSTTTPARTSVAPNYVVRLNVKPFCLRSIRCRTVSDPERSCKRMFLVTQAVEAGKENTESEAESAGHSEQPEANQVTESRVELSELGYEIKKVLQDRKEKDDRVGGDLLSGVAEEIREIEWPTFGKVLGTTGAVLGGIAGSSIVLLTVNAILAEFSDKVFAGKGVQDFFG